ncbi:MAG: hypothetical protein HKP58_12065 [Desulfatitalea sp.]|nr:hypothetical protein [Desulfatitalea sp.]NNK01137.1 hypothetical protein [Desulfatitalea sp.]
METTDKAPWHLWLAVGFSAAFTSFAAFGYVMTAIAHPAFIARFPPDLMHLLDSMPPWALAARTCGIWVGPIAVILLFLRSRHAFLAFVIVLAALVIGTLGEQWVGLPGTMRSTGIFSLKVMNWSILIAMVVYTHWMRLKRVLR